MIGVIIQNQQMPHWQVASLLRLQQSGNRIVLIRAIKKNAGSIPKLSPYLKFILWLESRLLKSRGNFLQYTNISAIKNTLLIDVENIGRLNSDLLPHDITSVISFLPESDETTFSLAERLSLDVLKLEFNGKSNGGIPAIIRAYYDKAGTINIALYKFTPENEKVKVYDT